MKKLMLVLIIGMIVNLSYAQTKPQTQTQSQKQVQTQQPVKSNRTAIKLTDLPKPITDSIAANYSDYKAIDAFKMDNKGVFTYQVNVAKDATKMQLYYNKDGKLLRKALVPAKTTNTTTTQPKPTTTTTKPASTPQK